MSTNTPPFEEWQPVWLKPASQRAVRYTCDNDPANLFNGKLKIIYIIEKPDGSHEYRLTAENGKQSEILIASEDCIQKNDPRGW